MRKIAAIILALSQLPAIASAAEGLEITPFTGHSYGGSFIDANTLARLEFTDARNFGLLLDFDSEPDKQIEVFLSRQDTQLTTAGTFTGNPLFDLTIDYYHIGGLYVLPEGKRVRPFLTGSFGLTHMVPKRADLTTEDRLSLSLGLGAKIFLTKRVGLRFDARAIYTALNGDTSVFCSGGCTIKVRSDGFIQTEIGAALVMRF